MDSFKIEWKESAIKELKKLPKKVIKKIIKKVQSLQKTPFPKGVRKLIGSEHLYRLRVGDYRIVYEVRKKVLVIFIIKVGHRKDIYKKV